MSDAESTTDPRTDPAWTSWDEAEELGVKVEVGHINDAWFWVEVAWDDDDLEQAAEASTPEEFEALLRVSAQPIARSDAEDQSVNQRLEELLHELVNWAGVEEIKHPAVELWKSERHNGAWWDVYRFGNRWYHHDGVPELTGEEFCDDEPSDPSGMEFSDEPNPSEW